LLAVMWMVALAVVANDLDRNTAAVGVKIVEAAALLLPAAERDDYRAEWSDDVRSASEDGAGIEPLAKALGITLIGAPLIAAMCRYDVKRRRKSGA
jgi:hypothetical protein